MIDWFHIGEVIGSNLFGAGVAYGFITAKIAAIDSRVERCENDIRAGGTRVDNLILGSHK